MAAFVGDLANVSIVGRCYGQRIMLSLWYRCRVASGAETISTTMNDLSTAIDVGGASAVMDRYLECLSNDYTSLYVRSQVIKPNRLAFFDKTAVHLGSFGAGSVANDSMAVTVGTDAAGRSERGTKHIGPAADNVSISGQLTVDAKNALASLGDALLTAFVIPTKATEWEPVLYHRVSGTATKLTRYSIGDTARTQRRRTVGVGI